ncbi:MAG: hypothetical protein IJJ26_09980, partial [Victivallales bacterium]|nr:hypothetical protein [Victivallales bacterium]
FFQGNARHIHLSTVTSSLDLRGDFYVILQGPFPPFGSPNQRYSLRVFPKDGFHEKEFKYSSWKLALEATYDIPVSRVQNSTPVSLASICNRSLVDGGSKPGWTSQGVKKDLRALKAGLHDFQGVRFLIPDSKNGDALSCLILGKNVKSSLPRIHFGTSATLEASSPETAHYLYLLHANGWNPGRGNPCGHIDVTYQDGQKETFDVIDERDCSNWWGPTAGINSALAWTTKQGTDTFGLTMAAFPLKGRVKSLTFREEPTTVWMVVGASYTDQRAASKHALNETVVKEGNNWLPLSPDYYPSTRKGSPLDFTGMFTDKPAGKYGRLVVAPKTGHLVYEKQPQKRVRLYGVNLVHGANDLTEPLLDNFIACAERIGYNTVRLHHFENIILDKNAPDSLTIDPAKLDRFFRLIARMKEAGIYICIDLYASRTLKEGDNIPEFNMMSKEDQVKGDYSMKNLVLISPQAMENWKTFARKVLTTKNKYTNLTLAEDPCIYALNLVNENSASSIWNRLRSATSGARIIEERFQKYLQDNKIKLDEAHTERGLFIDYISALQRKCQAEQMRFLRKEIHLGALITDINISNFVQDVPARTKFDLVDNHAYHDHPYFPGKRWQYPYVFMNHSSIASGASNPLQMATSRIFGKPFTVTEFNFCVPNQWRVEAAPVYGAYASFQDWDGLYRFAWSHGSTRMNPKSRLSLSHFDVANNIQGQMADRLFALLFTRGDVSPAPISTATTFVYNRAALLSSKSLGIFPNEFNRYGLWGLVGSQMPDYCNPFPVNAIDPAKNPNWTNAFPAKGLAAMKEYEKTGKITSSTGELFLDSHAKALHITTPRSEVFTGNGTYQGKVATITTASYQTVALSALDDKPLAESKRILLIQLSDIAATDLTYQLSSKMTVTNFGHLPFLIERAKADITLKLPQPMTVTPLALDGTPANKPYPAKFENGVLTFTVKTDSLSGGSYSAILTR